MSITNTFFKPLSLALAAGLYSLSSASLATAANSAQISNTAVAKEIAPELNPELLAKRKAFNNALIAADNQNAAQYQQLRQALLDYPLLPYADYEYLSANFSPSKTRQVRDFIKARQVPHLSRNLDRQWIKYLVKIKANKSLVRYQSPWFKQPLYRCHKLNAQWQLGQQKAVFEAVDELWLSGKNLPKNCDNLVQAWLDAKHLSPTLTWIRFNKALEQGDLGLARYLVKLFPTSQQQEAKDVLALLKAPSLTQAADNIHIENARLSAIKRGLKQLAKDDTAAAEQLYLNLKQNQLLSKGENYQAIIHISYGYKEQSPQAAIDFLSRVLADSQQHNEKLSQLRLRMALEQRQWLAVLAWIEELPPQLADKSQWRYWHVRAQQELNLPSSTPQKIQTAYQELAKRRDYYGFLAAEYLQQEPSLNRQVTPVSKAILAELMGKPGWQRMIELQAHNRQRDIRSEWFVFSSRLKGEQQWLAAAKLASAQQLHHLAISAAAHIKHWDDINLRFPTPHAQSFSKHADSNSLNPNWIFAIARQESGFTPSAQSHAGAVGLLQILPTTAKQTARESNLPYRRQWLTQAEYNIQLGSRYLAKLQAEFNNNVFTTAAYNAGPYRVKSWLKQAPDNISMDVWIDAIPYKETRNYVKNVIAYSVIYSRQLNIPYSISQFMGQEASSPLSLAASI